MTQLSPTYAKLNVAFPSFLNPLLILKMVLNRESGINELCNFFAFAH